MIVMAVSNTLSIVIVNWNTIGLLRDCLRSVYDNLGDLDAEVIVVDNASQDGSADMVAEEFPRAKLIRNSENRGFAAANNQALAVAGGRHILLLNSDTVVHGDVLARSVAYLESNPDVGVMGCRVLNGDGTMQPTCSRFPTLLNLILLTSGLWKLPWPPFLDRYQMRRWDRHDERDVEVVTGCYMLVRREAFEQVGYLDESFFFFGEETDWCRRFRDAGWKVRFAPVGEITHYGGGSSRSLNYKRDLMLSSAMVKLHLKHGGLLAGVCAWVIVCGFNLSRAVYWLGRALVTRNERDRGRRDHFISLVKGARHVWPAGSTYSSGN